MKLRMRGVYGVDTLTRRYFSQRGADIYDDNDNVHFMYPNEARLRNMTYGMTIHYDVDVEFIDILGEDEPPSYIANEAIDEEKYSIPLTSKNSFSTK